MPGKNLLVLFSTVLSSTALADASPRFEITPFASYRVGGEFEQQDTGASFDLDEAGGFGLTISGRVAADSQWEAWFSQQSTEVDVDPGLFGSGDFDLDVQYYHIGGNVAYDAPLGRPFIAATLGATRFDPDTAGLDAETFFSFALGGGIKLAPAETVGIRLEARVLGTLVDSDTDLFCLSDEAGAQCAIRVDGSVLWQFEAAAGISFRF